MDYGIEKTASEVTQLLRDKHPELFKEAFVTEGSDYIRTKVNEGSVWEKILDPEVVDENHPKVQMDEHSDTGYFMQEIEQDATAMEVSMRGHAKPTFVDGSKYTIRWGKIATEKYKKKEIELRFAPNIVKMLKENGSDWIQTKQDMVGWRAARAALHTNYATHCIGLNGGHDFSYYSTNTVDWTTAPTKASLLNLLSVITRQKLRAAKWVMSETTWNHLLGMDAGELGDTAGPMLYNGHSQKELFKIPVETVLKGDITDDQLTGNDKYFMEYQTGADVYSDIYLFVAPNYMGKLIKFGTDRVYGEWKEDEFIWNSWRYVGIGFGNIMGIAMMRVMLTT